MGELTDSPSENQKSERDKADRNKTDKAALKKKTPRKSKFNNRNPKKRSLLTGKKWLAGKISPEKYGFRWSNDKESDFPLIIELPSLTVPEEIQGPFPEDAAWRTKEQSPEKKPEKSFWPWN